jgi:glycosyltransferase involved in cell wall biosynthesis
LRKSRRRAAARSGRLLAVHGKRLPRRTAFNRLLALPGARVIDVSFTAEGVVVEIALRRRRAACSGCGQVCRSVHDRSRRRWRHLDLAGQRLHVEYCVRRVRCPDCGVRVEAVPFARPRARHTRDFEDLTAFLAKQMAKTPIAPSWRPTTPTAVGTGSALCTTPSMDGEGEVPALRPRGEGRDLRVGFLGRIDPKKNLDLLIDSMAQLPDHVRP